MKGTPSFGRGSHDSTSHDFHVLSESQVGRAYWFMNFRKTVLIFVLPLLTACGEGEPLAPEAQQPNCLDLPTCYTVTITADGAPRVGSVWLARDDLAERDHSITFIGTGRANANGLYVVGADVLPEDCDRLWLSVDLNDGLGSYSHYLSDGCGEHTLSIDVTTNIQVTGTITLDGSPFDFRQIGVAVGQMPPDLKTRNVRFVFSDAAGRYTFNARFDPAFCDDLWIWLIEGGFSHLEKVPGCGAQVLDVDATS